MTNKRFASASLVIYLLLSLLPIYWMLNMALKTNEEIVGVLSFWPRHLTLDNFKVIFTDESWYSGYINSSIYVAMNMVMSVTVALPAA
ncbi:MAG TPA: sugar ABC transporter permease, partial [Oxalobacteraceae bacterium]|nr:sugar ABC transporter permease [Oxalobacteraceae bacterium]